MRHIAPFQFITHQNCHYSYTNGARMALAGGCRWIQLRMKNADDNIFLSTGRAIKELCRNNAVLILDDRVDLVEPLDADGVHLGKSDMPLAEARQRLGPNRIIGATANSLDDILRATQAGADYIGCGPFRFTTTKQNLEPVLGLEGYKQIIKEMRKLRINVPLVAVGGITAADIPLILQTGVEGIALSGAILNAPDPVFETKRIINIIKQKDK